LRHPHTNERDDRVLLNLLGRLWLAGVHIDWQRFYSHERRHRVQLPTYPFERQRYWIDPASPGASRKKDEAKLQKKTEIADWFYAPVWKQSIHVDTAGLNGDRELCVIFVDSGGLGFRLAERLETLGKEVITVRTGDQFRGVDGIAYTINPR